MGQLKGGYTYESDMREAIYEGYDWWSNAEASKFGKTQAVGIKIEGEATHNTYLLPLAGIDKVDVHHRSEVRRTPAVIVLVLDASGSMKTTVEDDVQRYDALINAVDGVPRVFR